VKHPVLFGLDAYDKTKDTLGTVFYSSGSIPVPDTLSQKLNLFNIPKYYPEHIIVSSI